MLRQRGQLRRPNPRSLTIKICKMRKLLRNFPYGKKDLKEVAQGSRVSLVFNDSIETGTFHSVDDKTVTLSYGQGIALKSYPLEDLRSFALI